MRGMAGLERQAAVLAREIHLTRQQVSVTKAPWRSPVQLAGDLGLALDPWQRDALATEARDILLRCSRQAGKSTIAAILALHAAVYVPGSLTLILSPTERQSKRLLRTVRRHYAAFRTQAPAVSEGLLSIELRNGSEIHALPGTEGTVRGFADVDLLIIDEAARVDDDLYATVRPMLAVSGGRLIALSTPFGKRGFFYREWTEGGPAWHRAKVTAYDVPRIPQAWLEQERSKIGDWWFRQEFLVEFMEAEGQLFRDDDIDTAVTSVVRPLFGGFNNAA